MTTSLPLSRLSAWFLVPTVYWADWPGSHGHLPGLSSSSSLFILEICTVSSRPPSRGTFHISQFIIRMIIACNSPRKMSSFASKISTVVAGFGSHLYWQGPATNTLARTYDAVGIIQQGGEGWSRPDGGREGGRGEGGEGPGNG